MGTCAGVGFVLGLIPPVLLALLQGGVRQAVLVIVAYSVINFMIQSLLQPKFVGDAVGLSVTLTFLSLVFWTFVIGPLGALLAVPLTGHSGIEVEATVRATRGRRKAGYGTAARRPQHGEREVRAALTTHLRGRQGDDAPASAGAPLLQDVDRLRDAALPCLVGLGPLNLQHVPRLVAV